MDPLKFIFELVDQMTGPSRSITKELKGVEDAIRKNDRALKQTQLDKMTPGLQKTRIELGMQRDALMASSTQAEAFSDHIDAVRSSLNSVATYGLGAAAAVAGIGYEFAKSAVEVASFAEDNKVALEVVTGSQEAAGRVLKNMIALAAHLPINDMQAMGAATQFMLAGFKETDLANMVTAMAAVKGFNPNNATRSMDDFVNMLSRIKAAGLMPREITALSQELHLNVDTLAKELRELGYKGIKTVEDMHLMSHLINKDDFIEAVVRTVASMSGGDLSKLPSKLATTFSGLMSTIEGRKFALMIDLDTAPGYESLRGFLSNLVAATDPSSSSGKLISSNIAASFNDIFGKVFEQYAGPRGAEKIADKIRNDVIPAFKDFADVVGGIAGLTMKIVEGWAGLIRILRPGGNQPGAMDINDPTAQSRVNDNSWKALSPDAQARVRRIAMQHGIAIPAAASSLDTMGAVDLVDGLVLGMKAGQPAVAAAATELGQAAIDAHKEVTETHSPSRVFQRLGEYTAEGYAMGVRSGAPDAQSAIAMLSTPRPDLFRSSGGTGGGPIHVSLSINVDARGASEDDANAIAQRSADALPAAVVRVFDMIAMQYGNPVEGD